MAWTTSVRLRAQSILSEAPKRLLPTVTSRLGRLVQALPRWHPRYAVAVPLSLLGLLAPFLHSSIIAIILLTTGALLTLYSFLTSSDAGQHACALSPSETLNEIHLAKGQWSQARTTFQTSEIAVTRFGPNDQVSFPNTTRTPMIAAQIAASWPDLMARVSHELRTPLNAVIGFSDLMARELFGPVGDPRYEDYVQHIRDSANDLLKSTEDTLALTALVGEHDHMDDDSVADIAVVAAEAWEFVAPKAAAREIGAKFHIPSGVSIGGDTRTIRQILINMLTEAVGRARHGAHVVLLVTTEGDLVQLDLTVSRSRLSRKRESSSLAMCVARTLLELQGTSLLEFEDQTQGWHVVTVLDHATSAPSYFQPFYHRATQSLPAYTA